MIDVIGPLQGPQAERYGVVLCDTYGRWPEVALCRDATADTIVQFLETLFCREGVPLGLVSDNGPAFRSARLLEFLSKLGVRQIFSSPYSPQSCGLVERMNRTVKETIQSARLAREPRAGFLRRFLAEYRATRHPATGEAPFVLMRGRAARTALEVTASGDAKVRECHRRYQAAYKARHDRTATAAPRWAAGDWVRVRKPVSGRVEGQPSVRIARRTGPVSYRLTSGERVHARRLVPGRADMEQGLTERSVAEFLVPDPFSSASPPATHTDQVPRSPGPRVEPIGLEEELAPLPAPAAQIGQVPRRGGRRRRAPNRYSPDR